MGHGSNVVHLPTPTRIYVDRASRAAIRVLAQAELVTEREAVRSLRELGASAEEVDLVRTIFSVRRHRI